MILDPPCGEDAVVIDATAAPGNKTSHLSALMHNTGKVPTDTLGQMMLFYLHVCPKLYAFERNKKRYTTLKHMLDKAGCRNVEALNLDFLAVDPKDPRFCAATHM